MRTRTLVLIELLPKSMIGNPDHPDGIPKMDPTSVRDTAALLSRKLWDASRKYQRDGWECGDVVFDVNPARTGIIGTLELTRWD